MKYISLFSGIGGFEIAIHSIFPDAECIAYSEVDKFALKVYSHHFPTHYNLGDITTITEETIQKLLQENGGCDLLVGGFPCQNLSSLSHLGGNSQGLDGPKSGLFFPMLNMIEWILKYNTRKLSIIIENNASMKNSNKEMITNYLKTYFIDIQYTILNSADFGVQTRRRIYWTNFNLDTSEIRCCQTWKDVLEPVKKCKEYIPPSSYILNIGNKIIKKSKQPSLIVEYKNGKWNFKKLQTFGKTRWQMNVHSDTNPDYEYTCLGKCKTLTRSDDMSNIIIDRRKQITIRKFTPIERERLFFLPDGWISNLCKKTRTLKLSGNTLVVKVVEFILKNLKRESYLV